MKKYVRKMLCVFLSICLMITMMPVVPGIQGNAYAETSAIQWLAINDQQEGGELTKYEDLTMNLDCRETGGWMWEAETQTLVLCGFDGFSIKAKGDLRIRIEGENRITSKNSNGIQVESGILTIEKTSDDAADVLVIDVTQTKAGTVCDCAGICGAEIILNGGTVSVDYRLAMDKPHINTISGGARGINGKVSVYHGANLNVKAETDQSVTSNRGISGTLSVYGRGNVSVELDAVYEGGTEAVVGIGGFYASNLSTATVIIDAENHAGKIKATAIGMLQGVHFDRGGSLEVKHGCIHAEGNYYTEIVADNIIVSPSEYIFFYPGSSVEGDLCDAAGNPLYENILFTGVAKEQPLHFQEGPAWNFPTKKVGNRYMKYLSGGLGGRYTEDMRFVVTSGTFPSGVSLKENGYISGKLRRPCKAGSVEISVYRDETVLETFTIHYEAVTGPMLTINDEEFYAEESASGENWSYDGVKKILTLNGFTGSYIGCDNELTMIVVNENQIVPASKDQSYGINVKGDLRIKGSGQLSVKQEEISEDAFCGIYAIGDVQLEANVVDVRLSGEKSLTGIQSKNSSTVVQGGNLTVSIFGNQATGVKNMLSLNGEKTVSIDVSGKISAIGVEQLKSTVDYKGYTRICVAQDEGSGTAVEKLVEMNAAPNGEVRIEKGLVYVDALEWNGLDYNVQIKPEGWCCKAVMQGENNDEYFVLADGEGALLDGGITIMGTDLKLEKPISFTLDETWAIPEMAIYQTISKIDFRTNLVIEDNSIVTFGIVEGSLPEGIQLNETGYISGYPKVPCDAGTIKIQLYDDGEPINYIEPFTLSYGRVYGVDTYLTIDGTTYSRRTDLEGSGWSYDVVTRTLLLDGYEGGSIEAEKDLTIQLKGKNIIRPNGTEKRHAGIYIQDGDLHIQKTESDTEDSLMIACETDEVNAIYGIYMQNGFIEFYGGSLDISLHNATGSAKGTYYMNLMRLYDGANLSVDVCSNQQSAIGIERMFNYGHGNITLQVQGSAEWKEVSYAVDNLTFEDGSSAKMSITSTLSHGEGNVTAGIATQRLSALRFVPGGRLDIERGVVCFLFDPVTEHVQVEPAAYYIDGYSVTPNTAVRTMHDAKGCPITEHISFVGTEEKQPMVFTPNPNWRLEETKVYESSSISFETGFGKRPHDVEYQVVEGTLPSGMDFIHYHDQLQGYPIEICDAGEVTIAVISDGKEINRFVLPYGEVTDPEQKCIPVIRFYEDEHVLVLGESYRFTYDIDNFKSSVMERFFTSSDESIGKATCITSGVYPADFHSFKAGVVTITISLNLPEITPASATFYVREKKPKAFFEGGFIKGLDSNGTYEINGEFRLADKQGRIIVEKDWSDSRVRIQKVHEEPRCNSDIQTLYVLTSDNVEVESANLVYSGKKITPDVVVNDGTKTLVENKDYVVAYDNNINAGTAKVTITGIGSYGGIVEKNFEIDRAGIPADQVSLSKKQYTYSGSANKPQVSIPGLEKDKDYKVSYKNNTDAGEATAVVSGVGNYRGKMSLSFKIAPKKISSVTLSSTSYIYNGTIKKPTVTVKSGRTTILKSGKKGNPYVHVTYATGRKNPGTYKVTVKGKGNYTGIISKTFRIKVKNTSMKSVVAGSKRFTVKWTKLSSKCVSGYQIRYSTNSKMSNAQKTKLIRRTTTSATIKKLKAKKNYYIQIRTYKSINGKKYYSDWSKVKKVRTKV